MKVMNTNVEDKNQLILLQDLSASQFEAVMKKAERQKKSALEAEEKNQKLVSVLLENGFIEGEHFTNTFHLVNELYKGATYCEEGEFWFEVADLEFVLPRGEVRIIYKQYNSYSKEISVQNGLIDYAYDYRLGDTLRCSMITKQFRYYKAAGMLGHLEAKNARAEEAFELDNLNELSINNLIVELKTKYPAAEVSRSSYYQRSYRRSIDAVKVKFESNSYVLLDKVGYLLEKYDTQAGKETTEQIMNRFNSQKA